MRHGTLQKLQKIDRDYVVGTDVGLAGGNIVHTVRYLSMQFQVTSEHFDTSTVQVVKNAY